MHSATNQNNQETNRNDDDDDPFPPQSVSPNTNPQISTSPPANPTNNATRLDSSSASHQQPKPDRNTNFNPTFDLVFLPGYRFAPTSQELITHFLLKMINKQHLPRNKIGYVEDIYQHHPEKIVENHPQSAQRQWYFFTPRNRNYVNSADREAGDGYWKARKTDKEISDEDGTKIGVKKHFMYYRANDKIKSGWKMQEFSVADDHQRLPLDKNDNKLNDYVLCKILCKKYKRNIRKKNRGGRQRANTNQVVTDQDPTIVRAPIPDQETRPGQRVIQSRTSIISNPLYYGHPSIGGLPQNIVNHDHMRYGQPSGPRVPPPRQPYRPPPQPHVGLSDDERPNYTVRSSVDFNRSADLSYINQQLLRALPFRPPARPHPDEPNNIAVPPSAGPSSSTNPQPLPAPSEDYSWDLTELEQPDE